MKLETAVFDIGYPVYGAKFLNNSTLIVTGGGGEGNNGIPNRLTAVKVNFKKVNKPIKKFRELPLADNEDSPTSMDIASNVILLGCNQASGSITAGVNHHLRKFEYIEEHLKFRESAQIFHNKDSGEYQKCTYLAPNASVAAITTSKDPSIVYLINPITLDILFELPTGGDVKDLHFSPDSKTLCYITGSALETVSAITGRSLSRKNDFDMSLSKVRFLDDNNVLIGGVLKKAGGIVLAKYSIPSRKITKQSVISRKIKGIASMDYNGVEELVGIAGNESSVTVVRAKDFKIIQSIPQAHNFVITRITFSPDGQKLASTSAAKTVHIIRIPAGIAKHESFIYRLFRRIFWTIMIVLLGILINFGIQEGYFEVAIKKGLELYHEKFDKKDSSAYFTINGNDDDRYEEETTFLEVIESTTDDIVEQITRVVPTEDDEFNSDNLSEFVTEIISTESIPTTAVEVEEAEVEEVEVEEAEVEEAEVEAPVEVEEPIVEEEPVEEENVEMEPVEEEPVEEELVEEEPVEEEPIEEESIEEPAEENSDDEVLEEVPIETESAQEEPIEAVEENAVEESVEVSVEKSVEDATETDIVEDESEVHADSEIVEGEAETVEEPEADSDAPLASTADEAVATAETIDEAEIVEIVETVEEIEQEAETGTLDAESIVSEATDVFVSEVIAAEDVESEGASSTIVDVAEPTEETTVTDSDIVDASTSIPSEEPSATPAKAAKAAPRVAQKPVTRKATKKVTTETEIETEELIETPVEDVTAKEIVSEESASESSVEEVSIEVTSTEIETMAEETESTTSEEVTEELETPIIVAPEVAHDEF